MKLIPLRAVGVFFLLTIAFVLGFAIQDYFHERGIIQQEQEFRNTVDLDPTDLDADPYVLDLSGQGLSVLPEFVYDRPAITHLILSNNDYTGLPDDIGRLTALRELDVRTNQLAELPEQLSQTGLVDLNASENELTNIPVFIGEIATLRYADFSNNQITSLPETLVNLQDLKWLNLEENPLDEEEVNELRGQMSSTIINF